MTDVTLSRDNNDEISNPFGDDRALAPQNATANTDEKRAIAEVQSALVIARANPRNEAKAMERILNACQRIGLAEQAIYNYSRGGTDISGPSIRLAEAMAQNWGNMSFGVRELSQDTSAGVSVVQAFAWDMETNTRREVTFQVPHERHTKGGKKRLTDPRDIYETIANNGARRLRACILAVIPGDVADAAEAQCDKTMRTKCDASPEAIAKMVVAFAELGVTREQIVARIQRNIEAIEPAQLIGLKRVYASLRDGISVVTDHFPPTPAQQSTAKGVDGLASRVAATTGTQLTQEQVLARECGGLVTSLGWSAEELRAVLAENGVPNFTKWSDLNLEQMQKLRGMLQSLGGER